MDGDERHKPEDTPLLGTEAASLHMVVGVHAKASMLRDHRYAANSLYSVYTRITQHDFTNMVVFLLNREAAILIHGLVYGQIALLKIEQHSVRSMENNCGPV